MPRQRQPRKPILSRQTPRRQRSPRRVRDRVGVGDEGRVGAGPISRQRNPRPWLPNRQCLAIPNPRQLHATRPRLPRPKTHDLSSNKPLSPRAPARRQAHPVQSQSRGLRNSKEQLLGLHHPRRHRNLSARHQALIQPRMPMVDGHRTRPQRSRTSTGQASRRRRRRTSLDHRKPHALTRTRCQATTSTADRLANRRK